MPSLIEQLQADAANRAVRISDLLRRAKLITAKLDLPEFRKWIDAELSGYDGDLPRYRVVTGTPVWHNPVRGWQQIGFDSSAVDEEKALCNRPVSQPIAEIENLVERGATNFHIPYPAGVGADLCKAIGVPQGCPVMTLVNQSQLVGILDAVRNAVLDWSIKIEDAGIVGSEASFSPEEKAKAQEPATVYQIGHIENFLGHMGPNAGTSAITSIQNAPNISLREVIAHLQQHREGLAPSPVDKRELDTNINVLQAEEASGSPDRSKIRGALQAVKKMAGAATDKVLEIGIKTLIDRYLDPSR